MKKIRQSLSIETTGLTLAVVIGNMPAHASTFVFSQLGWEEDGRATTAEVIGTFLAEDKDGNNLIEYNPAMGKDEVSAYQMDFVRGDSTLMDFTHNLTNLDNLVYNLLDDTAIITSIGTSSYTSKGLGNSGMITQDGDSLITNTKDYLVNVTQVPEHTSWIGLVLFGFGAYLKRKIGKNFFN
ncbi:MULTISPECIES: hypothetical protein [Crocosphaera]|uniref:hypothetical protein n=1 Tax=Crocosphaera TaxID=263510 RepID=UPI00257FB7DC|nr:hypothetical protein [Crocosphaera sp.]NQZ60594.1 hypothetical protein [Crocosphaera sp.]